MSMRVAMKFTTLPYSLKCWQSCKLSTRRANLQRPARNFVMMCDSKFYRGAPTPTKGLLTSARYLSTDPNSNHNHNDGKGTEEDATMKATGWINDFNIILGSNPEMSLHTFIVIRVATWYTAAALFGLVTGMGPELGVGYLAAKFTGKLRQPFNVGLAAILSNQFPSFGTIKASALLGIVKPIPVTAEEQSKKPALQVKLEKALEWLSGPMDKYGFSYFVAGKINLAIVIIGTSYAVKAGLDVSIFTAVNRLI